MPYFAASVGKAAARCVRRDQSCGDSSGSWRSARDGGASGTGREGGPVNITFSVLAVAEGRAKRSRAAQAVRDLICVGGTVCGMSMSSYEIS